MHNLLIYSLSPNLIIASRKNPNLYNFYVSTKILNLQKNHVKMKKKHVQTNLPPPNVTTLNCSTMSRN